MNDGRIYDRPDAARFLRGYGLRTTKESLATMATRGGGPSFFKNGKYACYRQLDLETWAKQRRSPMLDSTSSTQGKAFDDVEQDHDLDDEPFHTGHPSFDEVTLLLAEEEALQSHIDAAGAKYDQQFI